MYKHHSLREMCSVRFISWQDYSESIISLLQSIITICPISGSRTGTAHTWNTCLCMTYDEEHISDRSCPALIPIRVRFTRGNQYFPHIKDSHRVAASEPRRLPDNSHSSAMHFSWHLQPCAITKKASTFLEWHLGPEWDILYQHYTAQMGTDIHSSFMEMLRKQSGRLMEMQSKRTQYYFYIL